MNAATAPAWGIGALPTVHALLATGASVSHVLAPSTRLRRVLHFVPAACAVTALRARATSAPVAEGLPSQRRTGPCRTPSSI